MDQKEFDLDTFDTIAGAQRGYELELRDPSTDLPCGRFISILGADSDAYRECMREIQRRRTERMNRSRRFLATPEELESDALDLLASATTGWRGLAYRDGTPVPFSAAAARDLYRGFPAIRDQVDQAVGDRALFLPKSASA